MTAPNSTDIVGLLESFVNGMKDLKPKEVKDLLKKINYIADGFKSFLSDINKLSLSGLEFFSKTFNTFVNGVNEIDTKKVDGLVFSINKLFLGFSVVAPMIGKYSKGINKFFNNIEMLLEKTSDKVLNFLVKLADIDPYLKAITNRMNEINKPLDFFQKIAPSVAMGISLILNSIKEARLGFWAIYKLRGMFKRIIKLGPIVKQALPVSRNIKKVFKNLSSLFYTEIGFGFGKTTEKLPIVGLSRNILIAAIILKKAEKFLPSKRNSKLRIFVNDLKFASKKLKSIPIKSFFGMVLSIALGLVLIINVTKNLKPKNIATIGIFAVCLLGLIGALKIISMASKILSRSYKPIKKLGLIMLIFSGIALTILLSAPVMALAIKMMPIVLLFIGSMILVSGALYVLGIVLNALKGSVIKGILISLAVLATLAIAAVMLIAIGALLSGIDWTDLGLNLLLLGGTILIAGAAFAGIGFLASVALAFILIGLSASLIILSGMLVITALFAVTASLLNALNIDDSLKEKSKIMMDTIWEMTKEILKTFPLMILATPLMALGMPSFLMVSLVLNSLANLFTKAAKLDMNSVVRASVNIRTIMSQYTIMLKGIAKDVSANLKEYVKLALISKPFFNMVDKSISPIAKVVDLFHKVANMTMDEFDENGYPTGKKKQFDVTQLSGMAIQNIGLIMAEYQKMITALITDPNFEILTKNSWGFFSSPLEDIFTAFDTTVSPISKIVDLFHKVANMTMDEFDADGNPTGKKKQFDINAISASAQANISTIMQEYAAMINKIATDPTFQGLIENGAGFLFFDSDLTKVFKTLDETVEPVSKIVDMFKTVGEMKVDPSTASATINTVFDSYTSIMNSMANKSKTWKLFGNSNVRAIEATSKAIEGTVTAVSKLDVGKSDKFIEMMKSMTEFAKSMNGNIDKLVEALSEKLVPALEGLNEQFNIDLNKEKENKNVFDLFDPLGRKAEKKEKEEKKEKVDLKEVLAAISELTKEISSLKSQTMTVVPGYGSRWETK